MKKNSALLSIPLALLFFLLTFFTVPKAEAATVIDNTTWGFQAIGLENDWEDEWEWWSEGGTVSFVSDGTGTWSASENFSGFTDSYVDSFTWTFVSNGDGSYSLTYDFGDEVWVDRVVLSADDSVMIFDSTDDTGEVWWHTMVLLDTGNVDADLTGDYYTTVYAHSNGGGFSNMSVTSLFPYDGTVNCGNNPYDKNEDGVITGSTGGACTYGVYDDGSFDRTTNLGTGYMSANTNMYLLPSTDDSTLYRNIIGLKKQDQTYSEDALTGTWALSSFGDQDTMHFAQFGLMDCSFIDSTNECTLKLKRREGMMFASTDTTIFVDVFSNGSLDSDIFGDNAPIAGSYSAGSIGNGGQNIILTPSFESTDSGHRESFVGIKCNACAGATFAELGTVEGTVTYSGTISEPTIVAVFDQVIPCGGDQGDEIDSFVQFDVTGTNPAPYSSVPFSLLLPDGTWYIATVINDADDNTEIYSPWAVWGGCDTATPIVISGGNVVSSVDLTLYDGTGASPNPFSTLYEAEAQSYYIDDGLDEHRGNFWVTDWMYINGYPTANQIDSVEVNGPGLAGFMLTNGGSGHWSGYYNFGATPPSPGTYTFTITDGDSIEHFRYDDIFEYFSTFPVSTSPAEAETVNTAYPTFEWDPMEGAERYNVHLYDYLMDEIWVKWDVFGASYTYDGTALPDGNYTWMVYGLAEDQDYGQGAQVDFTVSAGNVLHLVYGEEVTGAIKYRNSADKGKHWTPAKKIVGSVSDSYDPSLDSMGDYVHVVWTDDYFVGQVGATEIHLKSSTDGGATWLNTIRLSKNTGSSIMPGVAVCGTNVHAVWRDETDYAGYPNIYYKRSTDNGNNWSKRFRITNGATQYSDNPKIVVDKNNCNNVYIVWDNDTPRSTEIFLKKSTDGGVSWNAPVRISNDDNNSQFADIAIGQGSDIYVVWSDWNGTNYNVFFAKSTNSGAIFESRRKVTNNSTYDQTNPSVGYANGYIHVTWSSMTPAGDTELYSRRSSDGGMTWSIARLTNNSGDSSYSRTAACGTDVYVAFTDFSSSVNGNALVVRTHNNGLTWPIKQVTNNSLPLKGADISCD
jgi:hypothetical protein